MLLKRWSVKAMAVFAATKMLLKQVRWDRAWRAQGVLAGCHKGPQDGALAIPLGPWLNTEHHSAQADQ